MITLLDTAGVAAMLGVTPATVRTYRLANRRENFPPPNAVYGASPVWDLAAIKAWQAARPGRTRRGA